jgi:type IV secretion system protein VirB4
MLGDRGWFERSGEDVLPYVGHVRPDVALLNDGSHMAMAHIPGPPYELEDNGVRNTREQLVNTLARHIADDNVTLFVHQVRHPGVAPAPKCRLRSNFARELEAAYSGSLDNRLMVNDWFLSVVVAPRMPMEGRLRRFIAQRWPSRPTVNATTLRQLQDVMHVTLATMKTYGARRLGLRQAGDVPFTEIGEALALILTGRRRAVPLVSGSLAASIYTDRVIFGRRAFEIQTPGKRRFGVILGFREYPSKTRPGMLNELLATPYGVVGSHSFGFLTRAQAQQSLAMKQTQMLNAMDPASSQIEGLIEARDDVASSAVTMGSHHFSLAVYADTLPELDNAVADAMARVTNAGAVVIPEGLGMEPAYWAQPPGNPEFRTRPGVISSRNLAGLASFENFPGGSMQGHWGASLARFRTTGGTAYDYVPHVLDVALTAIFGPTGSGKTALLMFLLTMMEKALVDSGGSVALFDKNRGGELTVLALGGRYLVLRRGEASGLAPLRGLSDTPGAQDFLQTWITGLIRCDGGPALSPEEDRRLARGIRRQLAMPVQMRSIAGLREFLGYADPRGAGARLERWCRGGQLGWAFDNDEDEVRLDTGVVGFDLTQILEHTEVCAPAATYLLHRVGSVMDGRRFVMACDEFRAYLLNPLFAAVVDRFLLTVRKNNGLLILATQQPEHVLESPLGASLVAQCQTKILFPSPTADEAAYIDGLKCTQGEFRQVRTEMVVGTRRFLLKRDSGSAVCEFDLSGMPDLLAVLSGRANTVRLGARIRAELGEDPDVWVPAFRRRYHEARD